jgi:hypothetical protein
MSTITPIADTEIVFKEDNKWFSKNQEGTIISYENHEYSNLNLQLYSTVVVRGLDDVFDNLNPGADFTIVKNVVLLGSIAQYVPQPTNATKWISFKHYVWMAKQSMSFFCIQASVFYIMTKAEEQELMSHIA